MAKRVANKDPQPIDHSFSTMVGVLGLAVCAIGWPPDIALALFMSVTGLCVKIAGLEEKVHEAS